MECAQLAQFSSLVIPKHKFPLYKMLVFSGRYLIKDTSFSSKVRSFVSFITIYASVLEIASTVMLVPCSLLKFWCKTKRTRLFQAKSVFIHVLNRQNLFERLRKKWKVHESSPLLLRKIFLPSLTPHLHLNEILKNL